MTDTFKIILIKILYRLSEAVLKKHNPKIIAITGTVGKTSTKDAVYSALSKFESVRKSPKSYNSEFGVPLTIFGVKNPAKNISGWVKVLLEGVMLIVFPSYYPKWLVLEVGTDKPGDIKELTKWLKPDVVIVTKLSEMPVHVENFPSKEELFAEKGNLVKALKPEGALFLNADDKNVLLYRDLFAGRVILFGNSEGGDVSAKNYEISYDEEKFPQGIMFDAALEGKEPIKIFLKDTLGEQHTYHILSALALIKYLGEDVVVATKAFKDEIPASGRMRILKGINNSMLIDDTYNSSPVAQEEALKALKSVKLSSRGARRIAILGDMLELGIYTGEAHRNIGKKASSTVSVLATVGVRSRLIAEEALNSGMDKEKVFQFNDSLEAGKFIKDLVKKGDIVLVKGSQGMRMEKAVEELMANPEKKKNLLVRQEEEWKER